MLSEMLSEIGDEKYRREIEQRLQSKKESHHHSAKFELQIFTLLSRMGLQVQHEKESTSTLDFHVSDGNFDCFVEATVIKYDEMLERSVYYQRKVFQDIRNHIPNLKHDVSLKFYGEYPHDHIAIKRILRPLRDVLQKVDSLEDESGKCHIWKYQLSENCPTKDGWVEKSIASPPGCLIQFSIKRGDWAICGNIMKKGPLIDVVRGSTRIMSSPGWSTPDTVHSAILAPKIDKKIADKSEQLKRQGNLQSPYFLAIQDLSDDCNIDEPLFKYRVNRALYGRDDHEWIKPASRFRTNNNLGLWSGIAVSDRYGTILLHLNGDIEIPRYLSPLLEPTLLPGSSI